ncbi:150_t:CDS:1, partial [Ambispora leptoticha]
MNDANYKNNQDIDLIIQVQTATIITEAYSTITDTHRNPKKLTRFRLLHG